MKKQENNLNCEEIQEALNEMLLNQNNKKLNSLKHCSKCESDENLLQVNNQFDAALINTGRDKKGNVMPLGSGTDGYWEAGVGNTTGPISVKKWIPAFVAKDGAWTNSIYSNAEWISFYPNTHQVKSKEDVYFRIRFNLNSSIDSKQFFLKMKFFADNAVHDIYVNGIKQSTHQPTLLPQAPTSPYGYRGFDAGKEVEITLQNDWRSCINEIVVHVKTGSPKVGFLAQNTTNCYEADIPNYKPSIDIKWGDSACDCIESTDKEIMNITVCNRYSNLTFSNYSIGKIEVFHENGKLVETLPNGDPSVQLVPQGGICFGDIEPCSCVSREFILINNGAKAGSYRIKISGACYKVCIPYSNEDCFKFNICKD